MWKIISGAAGVVLLVVISLLAGAYLDLIVHKVTSFDDIIKAFAVHYDFANSEKWHGYFVDQERNGDWTIHDETLDLTSFYKSNRTIGSATDPKNLPPWDITGYIKPDAKYFVFTGAELGAGIYLLKAFAGGLKNKPSYTNTLFRGYLFGWNANEKDEVKFRRCPLVLIREEDVQKVPISVDDIKDLLKPQNAMIYNFRVCSRKRLDEVTKQRPTSWLAEPSKHQSADSATCTAETHSDRRVLAI